MESPALVWRLPEMEERSRALFGNPQRLPVALVALEISRDQLYAQAIANTLGIKPIVATGQLKALADAELLAAHGTAPSTGGRPGHLYARTDDDFWSCIEALGDRFRRPPYRR